MIGFLLGSTQTPMEQVAGATTGVLGVVTSVFNFILDNTILLAFLAVSFIGIAIALFKKLKRAA